MRAAFLIQSHQIQIKEIETPEPAFGEVRVRLHQVGICGSDVHLFLGHRELEKPTIIGHEGLGFVDKIGEGVSGRKIGERVAIEPNIPCRSCEYCLKGKGNICINKKVIGLKEPGCFAEYVCIQSEYAWNVPDELSDKDAVTLEPMAVAYHALFTSVVKPGDTIAIIGLGAIGLLLSGLAIKLGYKIIVSDINQKKIASAVRLGAIPVSGDSIEVLSDQYHLYKVSAIFECAGSEQTTTLAIAAAPRGSEIILVGLSEKYASFQPLKLVREGISILPSIIYDHPFDFRRVIQLIRSDVIHPGFIISNYIDFDQVQSGLELAAKGNENKIIVQFKF